MKLGETVISTGLKGVSLCRGNPMQSAGAQWHFWESWMKWEQAASSPGVLWQPQPLWEVGMELEGLEPELGVIQSFLYAQWLSLSYLG